MFCPKCGSEVNDNIDFCSNCGFSFTNDNQEENQNNIQNNEFQQEQQKNSSKGLNIASAILYPIIILIFSTIALQTKGNTLSIIIGLALAIMSCVSFLISGVYLIIIPLYFINLFKWGAHPTKFPKGIRILFGILAFLTVIVGIIVPLSI